MEWYNIAKELNEALIISLIKFLTQNNYVLFGDDDNGSKLELKDWKTEWTYNVEWRKMKNI